MQNDLPANAKDVLQVPLAVAFFGLMLYVLCLISFRVNQRLPWGRWIAIIFYAVAFYISLDYFGKLNGIGPNAGVKDIYNAQPMSRLMVAAHWIATLAPLALIMIQFLLDKPLRRAAKAAQEY